MYKHLLHTFLLWLIVTVHSVHAAKLELTEQEQQFLAEHPVITLGSDSNWMPAIVLDSDGAIHGYDAEILQQVNNLTGANFQLQIGNWKNMVQKAINSEIDGLSTSAIHESRQQYFNFSDPYVSRYHYLITSSDNPKNVTSIENLQGIHVGYQANDLASRKAINRLPGAIAVAFDSAMELTDALVDGQVDAQLGTHATLLFANRMKDAKLIIVDTISDSRLDLVFSIRKDYPEALSILNKGLAAIPEDIKQQIYEKWFLYATVLSPSISGIELSPEEKAWLINNPVLHVMASNRLPPFSYLEDGQTTGFYIDYMRLLASKLDIEVEFTTPQLWEQTQAMLENGELHVIPQATERKELTAVADYSHINLIDFNSGFAVRKDENNIHSMASLKGKVLAVPKDTPWLKIITSEYPNQRIYLADSVSDSLRAVVSGEADAVYGILPVLEYHIQKNWLSSLKTYDASNEFTSIKGQLKLAVYKENTLLLSILEKAQSAISISELAELKNQWMNVKPNPEKLALTRAEQNYLADKRRISMCIDPDWMPYEKNDHGKHIGMSADYVELFQNRLNVPIDMVPTDSWLESLEFGQSRLCDIFSLVIRTPDRDDYLLFTEPYINAPLVIVTDMSETFIDDITQITDKKIGSVTGYAYTNQLRARYPQLQLVEVSNESEGLEKVYNGELFGFIGTLPTVSYQIQRGYIDELKITGKFDEPWELSVGVRNDEPLLQSIFNKAIASLSTEEHQEILNKWISVRYHQAPDFTRIIYISLFFVLVILIFAYQNRSIRKINKKLEQASIDIEEQQSMVNQYVMILESDSAGIITSANEAFCRISGFNAKDLVNLPHSEIIQHDVNDKLLDSIKNTEDNHDHWSGEAYTLSRDLRKIHFNTYINAIYKDGVKVGYRTILEDITDKKHIEQLSVKDHLTNLYNRKKLEEIAAEQILTFERYNVSFSIILMDIDNFKAINDGHGHDVGDVVLRKAAEILKQNSRSTDYVGRWGGEEFLIICPHSGSAQALTLADHLREYLHQVNFVKVGHISLSAGITEFTLGDTFNTAFKRADNALYQAKSTGKNKSMLN